MRIKARLDYTNEALWLCCCLLFVLKDIKHINKSDHSLKKNITSYAKFKIKLAERFLKYTEMGLNCSRILGQKPNPAESNHLTRNHEEKILVKRTFPFF